LNVGYDAVEAGFCSEVVVSAACLLTTTSLMLCVRGCVGVDAQLLLASSTSAVFREGVEVVVDVCGVLL